MDHEELKAIVARHFRVYEAREDRIQGAGRAHLFFLMFPKAEFDARFEAVRNEILAKDRERLVFVRQEGGEDILVVADRPPVKPGSLRVNVVLFVLTLATTITAGAMAWRFYRDPGEPWSWAAMFAPGNLLMGAAVFALPLLLILGIHETAHFIAARRHGLRATLPYFLPFPPLGLPIGTLGAFISLKDPLPDRKALFDVGASGPLAGFLVAIPVLLLGAHLTTAGAVEPPDLDRPDVLAFEEAVLEETTRGRTVVRFADTSAHEAVVEVTAPDRNATWTFTMTAVMELADGTRRDTDETTLEAGESVRRTITIPDNTTEAVLEIEWDDGFIGLGDSLLLKGMRALGWGDGDFITHPTYLAGWVGILVTGINLLPAGQLDGGHVARAVFGERMRILAYGALGLLLYLGITFPPGPGILSPWLIFALFVVFMGLYHPPPLNDRTGLDVKRKIMAGAVLVVFAVTFVAQPVVF